MATGTPDNLTDAERKRRAAVLEALRVFAVTNERSEPVMLAPVIEGGRRGSARTIAVTFAMDYADWIAGLNEVREAMRRRAG